MRVDRKFVARQFEPIKPSLSTDVLRREAVARGRWESGIWSPTELVSPRQLNEQADQAALMAFQQAVRNLTELRELLSWELDDNLGFPDCR